MGSEGFALGCILKADKVVTIQEFVDRFSNKDMPFCVYSSAKYGDEKVDRLIIGEQRIGIFSSTYYAIVWTCDDNVSNTTTNA